MDPKKYALSALALAVLASAVGGAYHVSAAPDMEPEDPEDVLMTMVNEDVDPIDEIITDEDWDNLTGKEINDKIMNAGLEPLFTEAEDPFFHMNEKQIEALTDEEYDKVIAEFEAVYGPYEEQWEDEWDDEQYDEEMDVYIDELEAELEALLKAKGFTEAEMDQLYDLAEELFEAYEYEEWADDYEDYDDDEEEEDEDDIFDFDFDDEDEEDDDDEEDED